MKARNKTKKLYHDKKPSQFLTACILTFSVDTKLSRICLKKVKTFETINQFAPIFLKCEISHSPPQQNLSSCSCGCLASFNSSSPVIPLGAVAPSSFANNWETSNATIPPMAMSTALRNISSRENISAWFYATKCLNGMKPPIEGKYTYWNTTAQEISVKSVSEPITFRNRTWRHRNACPCTT